MFDNLVVFMKLVFTTLAIFNCMDMVSTQDELIHDLDLATSCDYKSITTQLLFQKLFKFVDHLMHFRKCLW